MKATDGGNGPRIGRDVGADELGHGPRFNSGSSFPEFGKVFDQCSQQFVFDFPKVRKELALFVRGEKVR